MARAIVFGVLLADAESDWPGRNQLMVAMAEHVPVVMLEQSPPTSKPFDVARPSVRQVGVNRYVMANALALRSRRAGRRVATLSAVMDGRWFRSAMTRVGLGDYLLWLTVNDPVLSLGVPDERLVYDCMDPNFFPHDQATFDANEFKIAARARVVFASAGSLFERMQSVNRSTYLLPNAAPIEAPATPVTEAPASLAHRRGPVVGYLGTIDWRFDAEHVLAAALALPTATFALVGRVNPDQEHKIAQLRALPNVVLPGQVSTIEGQRYIAAFDVGIIPFTPSPMNDAINPVKMYMYFAAGLPVVSTWIAECRANPLVAAARRPEEFVELIKSALDDGARRRDERIAFASANTWRQRAETAVKILNEHGLLG